MRSRYLGLTVVSLLFAMTASSERAEACGGTFCDSGPQAMPVDQSGENILFVLDGTSVEAHVQIQYQGSAERFAWIVPMPEIPDVTVGSQLLFQNLLQGTVPTYSVTNQNDVCAVKANGAKDGGAGGALGLGGSGGSGGGGNGPSVVYEKTVGAFEVVVLQGGTAEEVSAWLTANNYQGIPSAPTILEDYVAQNFVFVAVKLTAGADVSEIHPLVFKYPGNKPCVPLKLTAVAATEDMAVRTFFLGNDRVVPTNYKHIELNPVRIDWQNLGANYKQAVSQGADVSVANGHAFVTEYAGVSNVVSTAGVFSPNWSSAAFVSIAPEKVIDELTQQGLVNCYSPYTDNSFTCTYAHPLISALLHEFLPPPASMIEDDFYGCLSCNVTAIDSTKWNAQEFAASFQQRIVEPGQHAAALLAKWPYLTRMYTTISPAEMTDDPDFHAHPGLDNVTPGQQATRRRTCSGALGMILPDARQVALDQGQWPTWDSKMPWVEKIQEYPEAGGDPIVLVDNTKSIDAELDRWNREHHWPPEADANGDSNGDNACALGGHGGSAGLVLLIGAAGLYLARRRSIDSKLRS